MVSTHTAPPRVFSKFLWMAFQWSIPGTMLRPRTGLRWVMEEELFYYVGVSLASVAVVFFFFENGIPKIIST